MRVGKLLIVPSRLVLLCECQEKITNDVSYVCLKSPAPFG